MTRIEEEENRYREEIRHMKTTRTGHVMVVWFPVCKQHGVHTRTGYTDEPNLICPICNKETEGDANDLFASGRLRQLPIDNTEVMRKMGRGASLGEALDNIRFEWVDILDEA
jgi:hypothetical protein